MALGRSDNSIKNRWNVINGALTPKRNQSRAPVNGTTRFVLDYNMAGDSLDFYPKLITNSAQSDVEVSNSM